MIKRYFMNNLTNEVLKIVFPMNILYISYHSLISFSFGKKYGILLPRESFFLELKPCIFFHILPFKDFNVLHIYCLFPPPISLANFSEIINLVMDLLLLKKKKKPFQNTLFLNSFQQFAVLFYFVIILLKAWSCLIFSISILFSFYYSLTLILTICYELNYATPGPLYRLQS